MKMTQQVYGTQEVTGRFEFGTLIIDNDSSEFCGVWIADHSDINTKKMAVTGTKQTVDIESKMSGYSVGFGNVFNPFVTGAVASALPTYSNFSSNGRQHITQHTPSFMYFKDAHYNVGEMHLKNGMIYNENAEGKIGKLTVEHVKNRVEMEQHSRLFSMNFGAMLSFGMTPGLINGMMAVPVDRKVSSSSVHESYAQSGMHIKENHIEIGEKIEIKPELGNHEHLKVRDTAPISSIGSIMAGLQEIQDNWAASHEPHHNDIIIDAEPVENEVITEASKEEKPVIAVDADPKKPEKQAVKEPDYTIHEADTRELLDEIYDTDIAQYQAFDRGGSPDRVETELTKAVEKVQAVASSLANASDFSNMPESIVGADADPQSIFALGKGIMKVAEFAGDIFETIIEPAANAIGTKVRRVLRDDWNVSQAKAQDIGDITHVIAGILIPGCTAKVISKAGKLTSFGNAAIEATKLDKVDKAPTRIDIIKEPEMVMRATSLQGEWKGQFKLIDEIPAEALGAEFASDVYYRQVLFKDPKSGQMFRVFQRNDIDPNYVAKEGKKAGTTNLELMKNGFAPRTNSGEPVIIHHMGQDSRGPFVEVTKHTHKSLFHNQYGYGQPHPTNPVDRAKFNPIREAYWRAYAEQFKK